MNAQHLSGAVTGGGAATSTVHSTLPLARVAYLVNQHPKTSHTFVRREICALERRGVVVDRFAVRGWSEPMHDPADVDEQRLTRYLLRDGVAGLMAPLLGVALGSPRRFKRALGLCLRLARRADRSWPYHLVYLAQACRLVGWLRADGATHLHAHFGTNAAEVAVLTQALGGPSCSFTVHGPEEFDRPLALHLREKAAEAGFVVAISTFGRSQLLRWLDPGAARRVAVVHCGLDADFLGCEAPPPPDVARLVCIGRLCEQKGQLLLLDAFARLIRSGVEASLVLAGDGDMRGDIEASIRALGLRAHVRITGWLSGAQVRDELLAARALVLPSFAEGLPVVAMEAMALRRPVLSTFVAGIPELVRDGYEGWLVPAGDVDALEAALRTCLSASPVELARMGDAARQRVRARHDIDVSAARLAALFAHGPMHHEPPHPASTAGSGGTSTTTTMPSHQAPAPASATEAIA